MRISSSGSIFRNRKPLLSSFAIILLALIIANLYIFTRSEDIQSLISATPFPTRSAVSYVQEGQAHFMSGNMGEAITAYQDALEVDPDNVEALVELARLQTYYSALLTSQYRDEQLEQALANINRAVELQDSSTTNAVRAFVLDWMASVSEGGEQEALLLEASRAAERAIQLDGQNALAIAFRAEILADQMNLEEAFRNAEMAVELAPQSMDAHRVMGYVWEFYGNYGRAIVEYQAAAELTPNFTYLYIRIGLNYRTLALRAENTSTANVYYDLALENFERAITINAQLGINDPTPYLAIAKTYVRQGEFFAAARNAEAALAMDVTNPDLYGQLGLIRREARNYEGSIIALRCALEGCTADQNEDGGVAVEGLPLDGSTRDYYMVYGATLAALNYCDQAIAILTALAEQFGDDAIVMENVQESLIICGVGD